MPFADRMLDGVGSCVGAEEEDEAEEALSAMLQSWFDSGYQLGRFEAMRKMRAQVQMEVRRQLVAAQQQEQEQQQQQQQQPVGTAGASMQQCVQREVQLQFARMQLGSPGAQRSE